MASLHQKGKEALAEYHLRNQQRADELVQTLQRSGHRLPHRRKRPGEDRRYGELLPDKGEAVLQRCEEHMAHAGDNYFPFLWRFYKSHRATLFRLLKSLEVKATTQDTAFEQALRFLLENEAQNRRLAAFSEARAEEEASRPGPVLDAGSLVATGHGAAPSRGNSHSG